MVISIHAPREGSDDARADADTVLQAISIHAPRERATLIIYGRLPGLNISIHAPREGSDYADVILRRVHTDFYPRSP